MIFFRLLLSNTLKGSSKISTSGLESKPIAISTFFCSDLDKLVIFLSNKSLLNPTILKESLSFLSISFISENAIFLKKISDIAINTGYFLTKPDSKPVPSP